MAGLRQCCATGSLHTGTPTGRIEKMHGLDVYVADPPTGTEPKGIVVIIPDAFGWELPNNRILADAYAKEGGFKVLLPEFMNGSAVPAEALLSLSAFRATGFTAQLAKAGHAAYLARTMIPFMFLNRPSVAGPKIWSFLRSVKDHEAKLPNGSTLPLGTAGFCWGGHFVVALASDKIRANDGSRLTVCGFTAHPSLLKYPQHIAAVQMPLSVAASEFDIQMSAANAKETREILEGKTVAGKEAGIEHEFVLYEGAHHGFAVRADEDQVHEAEQGKKAEAQAVRWFTRWFEKPPPEEVKVEKAVI